jgi:hypothetical protein
LGENVVKNKGKYIFLELKKTENYLGMTKQEKIFKQNVNMFIIVFFMLYISIKAGLNLWVTLGGNFFGGENIYGNRCYL